MAEGIPGTVGYVQRWVFVCAGLMPAGVQAETVPSRLLATWGVLEAAGSCGPLHMAAHTPTAPLSVPGTSGLIAGGRGKSQRSEVAQAPVPGQRADLYVTNSEDPGTGGEAAAPWLPSEMLLAGVILIAPNLGAKWPIKGPFESQRSRR